MDSGRHPIQDKENAPPARPGAAMPAPVQFQPVEAPPPPQRPRKKLTQPLGAANVPALEGPPPGAATPVPPPPPATEERAEPPAVEPPPRPRPVATTLHKRTVKKPSVGVKPPEPKPRPAAEAAPPASPPRQTSVKPPSGAFKVVAGPPAPVEPKARPAVAQASATPPPVVAAPVEGKPRVKPPSSKLLSQVAAPKPAEPPPPPPPAEKPRKAGLVERGEALKKTAPGKAPMTKKGLVDRDAPKPGAKTAPVKAGLADKSADKGRLDRLPTTPRSRSEVEQIRKIMLQKFLEFKPAEPVIVQEAPNAAARIEERRAPRMKCDYETRCFMGLASFPTRVTEISLTGVRIETPERLSKGTVVELSPVNPSGGLETVRCTVAWCRKVNEILAAGLAFDEAPAHLSRTWVAVVLYNLGDYPG